MKNKNDAPVRLSTKYDDMSVRLDTVPALDRRADEQNWQNNNALCMHCMLTRDNKWIKDETNHNISAVEFRQFLKMFICTGKVAVCKLQQTSTEINKKNHSKQYILKILTVQK